MKNICKRCYTNAEQFVLVSSEKNVTNLWERTSSVSIFCVKQRIDEEEHPTLHQLKDLIPRYVIY